MISRSRLVPLRVCLPEGMILENRGEGKLLQLLRSRPSNVAGQLRDEDWHWAGQRAKSKGGGDEIGATLAARQHGL
jgi:hypothetical protein